MKEAWVKAISENMAPVAGNPRCFTIPEQGSLAFSFGGGTHPLGFTIQLLRNESGVMLDISNNDYLILTVEMDRYTGVRFQRPMTFHILWDQISFIAFG